MGRHPIELSAQAVTLHREAVVFDGHNDLPDELREDPRDIAEPQPDWHTDIPRLRAGGVKAQFWAAYVPVSEIPKRRCAAHALEQIDVIRRMVRRYPETFALARSAEEVEAACRSGRIASLIGLEGGHAIENSLGVLRMFFELGVRYMTLTHADTLEWVDAATDAPRCGGLSDFGEQVVREMNRLGMLVDISHVSADAMRHVLRVSRAPVIASHSCADAVAGHPRNVPDDVLRGVADSGGLVMVNFSSAFAEPRAAEMLVDIFDVLRHMRARYPDPAEFEAACEAYRREHPIPRGTVATVVEHIEHIVRVAGVDHVGLGSDFDGILVVPEQLEDVSCYPFITQVLLDRGFDRHSILKILGGNMLRTLRATQRSPLG